MKLAVLTRLHILEYTDVYCGGPGVGNRIEIAQERMAIQLDIDVAQVLSIIFLVGAWLSNWICKVEPQFVNARR